MGGVAVAPAAWTIPAPRWRTLPWPTGVPVYDRDGTPVGNVAHVLADERSNIFHGLVGRVPHTMDRPPFAAPDQIAGLFANGVTLTCLPATCTHRARTRWPPTRWTAQPASRPEKGCAAPGNV
jgi:hypothetical protein